MIFLDTNVMSEMSRRRPDERVLAWLDRYDGELALSTVALAEIIFGIERIRPDQRALRLLHDLAQWRSRFAGKVFGFGEDAALAYGSIMGEAARHGRPMSAPDGMIAAIARGNGARLATRNIRHFEGCGIELIDPWAG